MVTETGIDLVGEIPWEATGCKFYETREELLAGVTPYLTEGLQANEFCVWALASSLSESEAFSALRSTLPKLDAYLASHMIEIVEIPDWYARAGAFHRHLVVTRWRRKAAEALAGGYSGMRISRSTGLRSPEGQLLGLSAAYFQVHPYPTQRELQLVELYARLSAQIAEHRKTRTLLERSEAYLAEAQRLSHTGSWAYDPVSHEMFWSREQFRILGFFPGEVRPDFELFLAMIHPDDRASVQQSFNPTPGDARDHETDYRIIRPDGTIRYLHTIGHPVLVADKISEWVGTVVDVTERKLAKKALGEAHAELAHATRLATLGELATSLAHEMNQPLGAIVNNCNACVRLFDQHASQEEIREVLSDICSDAHRASSIIARTRELVKKSPSQKTLLALNEVFDEVLALANHALQEHHIAVRTEVEPNLPLVPGDRIQIQQVLLNLLINAVDAMNDIEADRRIATLRALRQGQSDAPAVLVQVTDFGRGLKADDVDRLFEPFYSTKSNGMGMGLIISRSIVEAHGGRLWMDANLGPSTTFSFVLPATQPGHLETEGITIPRATP